MKWINNIKISARLLGGFFIIAIIAAFIGIFGIINIIKIDQLDTELYTKMTEPFEPLINIINDYQEMRVNVRETLIASDKKTIQEYRTKFEEASTDFDKELDIFRETILTAKGVTLVQDLQDSKDAYVKLSMEAMDLILEGKKEEALAMLTGDGTTIARDLSSSVNSIIEAKIRLAKEASETNSATASKSIKITTILVITGLILAIMLGVIISRSISKPVKKLLTVADEIADGNLDVAISIKSKDEIGNLANAFQKMTDNLNDVMKNINIAAEQVATGARQVSDSSMALSQGATEQASSIEELTASIEEISSQTKQNAKHADEANQLSLSAKEDATKGNLQMKEMQNAMEEINEASSNISKIIKVIDEIAFQTNILALNAAVEAARAGQHGKGFAVVAEEVRNLAARSADAAKETTVMIEGSIKKVEVGTNIANETAEALNKIVEGVDKATHIVGSIAVASNEQAQGIEQINQGIMQVSTVVQTNSVTSEESAAASEELSSQSELLKAQVLQFKLRNGKNKSLDYDNPRNTNKQVHKITENSSQTEAPLSLNDHESTKPTKIVLSDHDFGKY